MATNIRDFSVEQVQDWLFQNGFSKHMEVLASCEVNGEFLCEMTESELTQDLGFTLQEAQQLVRAVQAQTGAMVPVAASPYSPTAAAPYTPSAAAMGSITPPTVYSPQQSYSPNTRAAAPAPAYIPSAAASAPIVDPRVQELERENATLRQENQQLHAETARLNGELQNMKAMYDQLLQQQKHGVVPTATATAMAPYPPSSPVPQPQTYQPQPAYQQSPPPQPVYQQQQPPPPVDYSQQPPPATYTPTAQPTTTTFYAPPQQQQQAPPPNQQTAYAQAPAPPTKTNDLKQTGFDVVKGAGVGALGGATMGAVAGAILPGMDAGDGAKAGAAMGALGGGVNGLLKNNKHKLFK